MTLVGIKPSVVLPEYWSPTLLNVLRICPLQLAYSLDPTIKRTFDKLNTYSAMGICAHQLTERAWKKEFSWCADEDLEEVLSKAWDGLVLTQYTKLKEDWPFAEVPLPKDWPYFAVTQVRTIARIAQEIRTRTASGRNDRRGIARVEQKIRDQDSRIEGIPDRVIVTKDGFFILDLKTGHSVSQISDHHRRQLLIYAHLVAQTTGVPLLAVGLVTAGGEVIWEDVGADDVAQVVGDAKDGVDNFKQMIYVDEIGVNCEPSTCRYCPYKLICSSFWRDENPYWYDYRGVVGRVIEIKNQTSFCVQQLLPESSVGRLLTVTGLQTKYEIGQLVAITDCSISGSNLRCHWYSRIETVEIG